MVVGQTHLIRVFCRIRSRHWKIHPEIKIMVGVIMISMRLHKAIDPRGGGTRYFHLYYSKYNWSNNCLVAGLAAAETTH